MKRLYRVARFAELSGVTVRTLHHYDQIGLLRPARHKQSQHRFYEANDFARLQQIRTLRGMGFTLEEIKTLLDSRPYNLRQAMLDRKAQLDAQIATLQAASAALEQALAALAKLDAMPNISDNALLLSVLHTEKDWLRRHYSPEEWQVLMQRASSSPPEKIQQGEQAWVVLIEAFRDQQHLSPDAPQVQQLAAQMHHLIEQFTGGNPAIEGALNRMYADFEAIPDPFRQYDKPLHEFMSAALTVYRQGYI
jgi:DNA-binding transcriptional MerR regulator